MPRQVRIEFEGAVYHVMCRGDRREAIYEDDTDREIFLATLGQACAKTGWRVFAYALMANHYHLLLETPKANLVAGMTWFQSTYTKRYNARHGATGHLFGGRYKATLVEADGEGYFLTALDYIHLNPARAGLVDRGDDGQPNLLGYRWTSLGAYAGRPSNRPPFLATARSFAACELGDAARGRREFVRRLVERVALDGYDAAGLTQIEGQSLHSTLRRGWCYGGATFREKALEVAENLLKRRSQSHGGSYSGDDVRDHAEGHARAILAAGLAELDLRPEDLPLLPKGAEEKAIIALKIRRETAVRLAWIATHLSMGSTSNVSNCCTKLESRASGMRRLKGIHSRIDCRLSA